MVRNKLSLLVVGVLALAVAVPAIADDRHNLPNALKGVHRIVTLGDSITQGGAGPGGYVWLIDKILNKIYPDQHFEVINAGISGHKSTDMSNRFDRDVMSKKPDLVTISVGVNDVWHGYRDFARGVDHPNGDLPAGIPLERYVALVTEMVDRAQAANIKVALVAPTLIYENLDSAENRAMSRYVRAMEGIAREKKCMFIDLNAPFRKVIGEYQKYAGKGLKLLTVDGVHMNLAGNRLMAVGILRGLGVGMKEIEEAKP
ncbi:MAG: SGNH/GDSL hydrolase family protein [Chthonomonadales bacterium]